MSEETMSESVELTLDPEAAETAIQWLQGIGTGAAQGAATGMVGGPWGALIGGLAGAGLGALQTAQQQQQQQQQRQRARRAPPVATPSRTPPATPPAVPPTPAPAPEPPPAPPPQPTAPTNTGTPPSGRTAPSPTQVTAGLRDLQRLLPILTQLASAFANATRTSTREPGPAQDSKPKDANTESGTESNAAEDWGGVRYSDHLHDLGEHHPIPMTSAPTAITATAGLDLDTLDAGEHEDAESDDELGQELTELTVEDLVSADDTGEVVELTLGEVESVEGECTWESTS